MSKESRWVKTYAGGKPNYTTPVHASDISQERVDETVKDRHEDWYGQWQWQCGYERGWDKAVEAIEAKLKEKNSGSKD